MKKHYKHAKSEPRTSTAFTSIEIPKGILTLITSTNSNGFGKHVSTELLQEVLENKDDLIHSHKIRKYDMFCKI